MIKTIVFDFGNVMYPYTKDIFFRNLTSTSPLVFEEIKKKFFQSGIEDQYSTGKIDTEEFYLALKDKLDLNINKKKFLQHYTDIFTPNEEVLTLIQKLDKNYRLQLYSDTNPVHYQRKIKTCPVYHLFAAVTLSFRVGVLKESEKGYREVIQKSGNRPEEIVFTDDKTKHIRTAEKLGIKTIHFRNSEQLKEELKELGVEF